MPATRTASAPCPAGSFGPGQKTGASAVEALMAILIVVLVGVPLLGLLFQERATTQKGHSQYLAILAGREEVGDLRFMLASGVPAAQLAHDWKALSGSAMARLGPVLVGAVPGADYQPMQDRIETKVTFQPAAGRMLTGTVEVRRTTGGTVTTGSDTGVAPFAFGVLVPGPVVCK